MDVLKKRLRNRLSQFVSSEELAYIYNSYDVIGDIAIIRVTGKSRKYRRKIAEMIMNVQKNVRTVLAQTSSVCGDFRLRKLDFVAGENKTATVHKEYSCLFSIDVGKCYFSPRLLYERMRIAKQVVNGEVVVNMFAGVGCFSIVIAKHSKAEKVYSIDVNAMAIQFMQENTRLNKVYQKVIPIQGDAKEIIEKRLRCTADRVLMPLPEKAFGYLPYAMFAVKEAGGWIHYYDFEHAKKNENPVEKVKLKVAEKLRNLGVTFVIPFHRVVRTTGPNWHQVVLDIKLNGCGNNNTYP
jgi:tRNA (guanine37-N1)-methyltransferase